MACECHKLSGMKKKKAKIGAMDNIASDLMDAFLPGAGMIAAHEIKGMLPESFRTSLGESYSWVVNGAGILAGAFVPGFITDPDLKKFVKPVLQGVAAQCLYALYVEKVRKQVPASINRGWQQNYALGKQPRNYALGCGPGKMQKNVYAQVPDMQANFSVNPGGMKVVKVPVQNELENKLLSRNGGSMAPAKVSSGM